MDSQMKEQIEERLKRYIDDYGWGWGVTARQINFYFGTEYTVSQLQDIYKSFSRSRKYGIGNL